MTSSPWILCLALVALTRLTSVCAEKSACDEGWIYNPKEQKCIKLIATRKFHGVCREHKWGLHGNTSAELFQMSSSRLSYVTEYLRFLGQKSTFIATVDDHRMFHRFRHYIELLNDYQDGWLLMLPQDTQDSVKIGFEIYGGSFKGTSLCEVGNRSEDVFNVSCPADVRVVSTSAVSATFLVVPGKIKGRIQVQLSKQSNSSLPVNSLKLKTLFPVQADNHTVEGLQPDTWYNVTFLADTNVTGQSVRCDLTISLKTSQETEQKHTCLSNSPEAGRSPVTKEPPPHVVILSALLCFSAFMTAVLGFLFWRKQNKYKQANVDVGLLKYPQAIKGPKETESSADEDKYTNVVDSDPEKVAKADSTYLNVCRTSNAYDQVNKLPEVENIYEK